MGNGQGRPGACNLGRGVGSADARASRDVVNRIGSQTYTLARGRANADHRPSLRAVRDLTREARLFVCVKGVCEQS